MAHIRLIVEKICALRRSARSAATSPDVQNQVAEARLRLERRAGELLAGRPMRGGDRKSVRRGTRPNLKDLGVSYYESSHWQRLASVPCEAFEGYLRQAAAEGKKPTASALLDLLAVDRATGSMRIADPASDADETPLPNKTQ